MILPPIKDELLELRIIEPDRFDLESYLSWMRSPDKFPYIMSTREDFSLQDLKSYLNDVNSSKASVQFAILLRGENLLHIGNIKFHDVSPESRSCYVGFLIGSHPHQGAGLARRAFELASKHLCSEIGITIFRLAVARNHMHAIKSYSGMGFKAYGTTDSQGILMSTSVIGD